MGALSARKVAILVDNYFEQAEFEEPLKRLKDEGAETVVISSETLDLQGMQHDTEMGDTFKADMLIDDAISGDFEALILPGGVVNADKLRMNQKAREWVQSFIDEDKIVAAICHAPWLLISSEVVNDRQLTSFPSLQDDIKNAGGEWSDETVVIDGNLITSRKPDDLPDFNDAIVSKLCEV
jgi:protease I